MNSDPCSLSKNMFLGFKIWKTKKNFNSYGLMKMWSNINHSKVLFIKQLNFSRKRFFISVYHFILHHILNFNNKIEMWINNFFFILWCFYRTTNSYFSISKVHYYQQISFFNQQITPQFFHDEFGSLNPNPMQLVDPRIY
jgi:hypothetical protein